MLYTAPLRRVMVHQSGLPYPEGVAAAEVLRVGEAQRYKAEDKAEHGPAPAGLGHRAGRAVRFPERRKPAPAGRCGQPMDSRGGVVFRVAAGFSPASRWPPHT
ncbi:MAG: hypothetical protein U1E57_03930 [Paenacidovorax caeni]